MKIAVIDIGSNSVRLMLWANGKSLYKRLETTRLGKGVALTGELSSEAIERTAAAVAAFRDEALRGGADRVCAFATAAVRAARNGTVFCRRVAELCGLDVDVVPGEEEALLALFGALGEEDGGIVDIGGASTEVCLRESGRVTFSVSLDLGAVRLFDLCCDDRARLTPVIERAISPLIGIRPRGKLCAVGGTASTVAMIKLGLESYDAEKTSGCILSLSDVNLIADRLFSLSIEERRTIAPRRADIIAGGTLLLLKVMEKLSVPQITFSDRDNLEGYLAFRRLV